VSPELLTTTLFFAYLAITLGLGCLGRRNMARSSVQEYYTAGKSVGPWLGMATYAASNFSAFTFLGSVGIYYSQGLGYAALPIGQAFFMGILFPTVGYKIWKFSRDDQVLTLTDIVARRYEEDHLVRVLFALSNIVFMFFLMGVQIVGISYVVEKVTGGMLSYTAAACTVAGVLIIYQSLGGMRGVVYTDVLQLFLLSLTLVSVLLAIFISFDLSAVFQRLAISEKAALLSAPGPQGIWNPTYWTTSFIALGVGVFFWPHLWARIIASRDKRCLWSIPVGTILGKALFLVLVTPLVAFVAADLWPDTQALAGYNPDQIMIRFTFEYLPIPLAALMLAGASAAAMSTVDSLSLVLSSIAFHDLYERFSGSRLSQARKTLWARLVTALFPAVATLIALNPPGLIVGLVIDTSYAAFTALAPAVIFGFYWRRATTQGARWSMGVGLTAGLVIMSVWQNPFGLDVYNGFWTLLIATVVLVVVSCLSKAPSEEVLHYFGLSRRRIQS
jgi:SSS family solute:Na+ symporter